MMSRIGKLDVKFITPEQITQFGRARLGGTSPSRRSFLGDAVEGVVGFGVQ
ncbi:hypothetical protein CA54_51330 [Symmachiella macrocystis]|uniref:Uncharacterized protein n=1 Tax=Symmachiella macrocystis TaxID=2527985 RepID=A0A5C6B878_9PLAN|nr:hypothetical protein CA54_51330 [Symmachiella macrocystis]